MILNLRHALLCLLCVFLLPACQREQEVRQESYVFGTRVEIISYGTPEANAHAALAEALRELDRLHKTYHAWQSSDLTTLNANIAQGLPSTVSPEMASLLNTSREISAQSDGRFDPAIGQLIALWGFQSESFVAKLPEAAQIQTLVAARPRSTDLVITDNQVSSRNRAVQFDFGGIVKGYGLDQAAQILRKQGINNALINIGGNVMALGKKGDVPWTVGIQSPRSADPLATLPLYDGEAIGTSGDYQRFFEIAGKRYSHLIDPNTGWPSQGAQAVTVLIPRGARAGLYSDALSKPLFLAADQWPEQARKLGVAHVLRVDAQGHIQVSKALRARLHWAKEAGSAQTVLLE